MIRLLKCGILERAIACIHIQRLRVNIISRLHRFCDTLYAGSGNSLDVHSNGHSLAVALSSGSIRIYDIRCKKLLQHYLLHDNATDISWHPSSGFLLTSGKDKNIHVVDVLEGKPLFTLTGNAGEVHCVQFAKTGEYFASGGSDQNILVCSYIYSVYVK